MSRGADARWAVLGLGRAGLPLALALDHAGRLAFCWTRTEASADRARQALNAPVHTGALPSLDGASVVLLAVPDDRITRLAASFSDSECADASRVWLHCSGAHDSGALRAAGVAGPVGSCHPLFSFTGDGDDLARIPGAFVAIEGDAAARAHGTALADLVGGAAQVLSADAKAAYHAAAVLASNGVYAVLGAAQALCAGANLTDPALRDALASLAAQSAMNAIGRDLAQAATGPVVRGDVDTVRTHIARALPLAPAATPLYLECARWLSELAEEGERAPERSLAAIAAVLAAAERS